MAVTRNAKKAHKDTAGTKLYGSPSWMELQLESSGFGPIAGVDEAGRGACCGPVTIAACVLPAASLPKLAALTDSKN